MSNKYQSNVRTFTARNLVWNTALAPELPVVLHTMNAPVNLIITTNDIVSQFYRCNWGMTLPVGPPSFPPKRDWNLSSSINIKKVGMFSNFADGLVFQNSDTRMILRTSIYLTHVSTIKTAAAVFTKGSNYITGTDLDVAFPGPYPSNGLAGYISDSSNVGEGYMYAVYDVAVDGSFARISDFAYRSVGLANVNLLVLSASQTSRDTIIPTFNALYESEIFFNTTLLASEVAVRNVFLAAEFVMDPPGNYMYYYTKTVDESFNALPVTVDSMIEVEVTPFTE